MKAQLRRGLGRMVAAVAATLVPGCVQTGNALHVIRTAEGKRLKLEAKPPRCDVLISRSVIRSGGQIIARITYAGRTRSRDKVEQQLHAQACKLGADAILIEREDYGDGADVSAMAIAYPDSEAASQSPGKGGDDHTLGEVTGTCFAVDGEGDLITAEHVIHDAKSIEVQFEGEEPIAAAVLDRRPSADIAVLKVQRKSIDFLPFSPSKSASVGDRVFTFGFPVVDLLGKEPKFTDGAISALAGYEGSRNLMQVTIPIQPGNSGGPVGTEAGFAIGIVVSTVSAASFMRATGALPQGLNYAVKSELAMAALEPPDLEPAGTDRQGAVARARHAVCAVRAAH